MKGIELVKDKRVVIMVLLFLAYVIGIGWKAGVIDAFIVLLFFIIGGYVILKKKEELLKGKKELLVLVVLGIVIMERAGVMLTFMGLLCFIIGALIFVYKILPSIMLSKTGFSTQGVVDDLELAEHFSGGAYSMYNVYYSFELPGGEVIPANTNLSKNSFASLVKGQTVRVLYDQNHPGINCLADYRPWWVEYLAISSVLIFCVVGVLILYFFV